MHICVAVKFLISLNSLVLKETQFIKTQLQNTYIFIQKVVEAQTSN